MSKTTEVQIEKSRNLIEGLRRHVREMGESAPAPISKWYLAMPKSIFV